jgi:hypothetical protein
MMTIRQIERLWGSKSYERLVHELTAARPEAVFDIAISPSPALTAAAFAMIRLEELDQSHVPLFGNLLRTILATQDADGGWVDPATTALCLRALHIDGGRGLAIERGLDYLAGLQQDNGLWPREPLRRMPSDPVATAYILFHLGDQPAFRSRVRFDAAVAWFESNAPVLDEQATQAWSRTQSRCRQRRSAAQLHLAASWS